MKTSMTEVSATASVDPSAHLGEGVSVGDGAIIGPQCVIGAGTIIRARAIVVERTTLGEHCDAHPLAVLGGDPQDRAWDARSTGEDRGDLVIGSHNVFREGSTVSRGAGASGSTILGDNNYLMAFSHIGHNARVGSGVNLANVAMVGGHATVGDGSFLSSTSMVHQFCHVGERVMFQARATLSMHAPPFVMIGRGGNCVVGLNTVGIRRCPDISRAQAFELRRAFRMLYRRPGGVFAEGLAQARREEWTGPAARFIAFMEKALLLEAPYARGVVGRARARAANQPGDDAP